MLKKGNHKIDLRRPLQIVVAVDLDGGFGKDGKIPWNEPEDMKHFRKITKGASCIMGRRTYQDMYEMAVSKKKDKDKPVRIKNILQGRESFVVTNTLDDVEGAKVVRNISEAAYLASKEPIFVLGGEKMFWAALPYVNTIHMTIVNDRFNCDRFFPIKYLKENFHIVDGKEKGNLTFLEYARNAT